MMGLKAKDANTGNLTCPGLTGNMAKTKIF